jgi:hypothetical protein
MSAVVDAPAHGRRSMTRRCRLWTFAMVCAGALALTTAASAGRLSLSSGTFRATFTSFEVIPAGLPTHRCAVTLEGSLHSQTVAKVAGALVGQVTRGVVGSCGTGSITIEGLPWHLTYGAFAGTLPNITSVTTRLVGPRIRIRDGLGLTCTFVFSSESPLGGSFTRESGRALTALALSGSAPSPDCGISGTVAGTSSSLTALGSSSRVTLTLI